MLYDMEVVGNPDLDPVYWSNSSSADPEVANVRLSSPPGLHHVHGPPAFPSLAPVLGNCERTTPEPPSKLGTVNPLHGAVWRRLGSSIKWHLSWSWGGAGLRHLLLPHGGRRLGQPAGGVPGHRRRRAGQRPVATLLRRTGRLRLQQRHGGAGGVQRRQSGCRVSWCFAVLVRMCCPALMAS